MRPNGFGPDTWANDGTRGRLVPPAPPARGRMREVEPPVREQADETVGPPHSGEQSTFEIRPLTTAERIGEPGGGGGSGTGDDGHGGSGGPGGPGGNGSPPGREPQKRMPGRTAIEWGVLIVAALVIAIVIRTFVFQAFYIPSESMVPTLKIGDRVLVNKLSYKLHDPRRGDIAVFKAPAAARTEEIKDLVKRVVGLPGETIEGKDGHIFIDDRALSEPYLPAGTQSRTFPAEKVPPNAYFMLGDNRQYSKDSTFFGPIKRGDLIGRVFMRIWPPSHLGFL
jgi:signal peptidase I